MALIDQDMAATMERMLKRRFMDPPIECGPPRSCVAQVSEWKREMPRARADALGGVQLRVGGSKRGGVGILVESAQAPEQTRRPAEEAIRIRRGQPEAPEVSEG